MTQRNARMMDLRAGELQRSHDAAFAWKTSSALYQALPCLRGFWGMGAHIIDSGDIYISEQSGHRHTEHDMIVSGTALFGYSSLIPWVRVHGQWGGADAGHLTIELDSETYDITGAETYVDDPGLTVGAWWKFDSATKTEGLMSKEDFVPQISWFVAKTNTGTIQFSVSGDGTATASAFSTNAIDATNWHLTIARYDPSTEIVVFLDGVKGAPVVASIPAALHDSTAFLEIGNNVPGFTQNDYKKVSMAFICASRLSDAQCQAVWHHTRAMYGQ